jgi:hypothetical protein
VSPSLCFVAAGSSLQSVAAAAPLHNASIFSALKNLKQID